MNETRLKEACPECKGDMVAFWIGGFGLFDFYYRQYLDGRCLSCSHTEKELYERYDTATNGFSISPSLMIVDRESGKEITLPSIGEPINSVSDKPKVLARLHTLAQEAFNK